MCQCGRHARDHGEREPASLENVSTPGLAGDVRRARLRPPLEEGGIRQPEALYAAGVSRFGVIDRTLQARGHLQRVCVRAAEALGNVLGDAHRGPRQSRRVAAARVRYVLSTGTSAGCEVGRTSLAQPVGSSTHACVRETAPVAPPTKWEEAEAFFHRREPTSPKSALSKESSVRTSFPPGGVDADSHRGEQVLPGLFLHVAGL